VSDYLAYLPQTTPAWLLGPFGAYWESIPAQIRDVLIDMAKESVKARFPMLGPTDALAAIASERSLEKMPVETEYVWRGRLLTAFDAWQWGGTKKGIVDNVTLTGLTNVTVKELAIDWPDTDKIDWARFWVLVNQPHPFTAPKNFGAGWAFGDGTLLGLTGATQGDVERLRRIVRLWKGAHAKCVAIILLVSGQIFGNGWAFGAGTAFGGVVVLINVPTT